MDSEDEQYLKQRLDELQRDVSKKQKFEPAVAALTSLLRDRYSSASLPLRKSYLTVVSRVATVLKTRYTSPGFRRRESRFLFEGHLTVDREPPRPQWLVQESFLASAATLFAAESSANSGRPVIETGGDSQDTANLLQSLIDNLDSVLPPGILDDVRGAPRVPPGSKKVVANLPKVVANLPVITITEEKLKKLGEEAECCICKENLVVNDKMQELPCKHTFHPPCLKPTSCLNSSKSSDTVGAFNPFLRDPRMSEVLCGRTHDTTQSRPCYLASKMQRIPEQHITQRNGLLVLMSFMMVALLIKDAGAAMMSGQWRPISPLTLLGQARPLSITMTNCISFDSHKQIS
ncbi:hypothetical protein ACLB2K_005883 [Fragaria x ananassa]